MKHTLSVLVENKPGALMRISSMFARRGYNIDSLEVVGSPEEIDSFEELVRPHGVKELVRTGRIGLARASDRQGSKRRQHVLR